MEDVGILYNHLVYFTATGYILYGYWVYFVAIWYISWLFIGYIFPVLVYCTKKNLATLVAGRK
jgi:hypothetical protein